MWRRRQQARDALGWGQLSAGPVPLRQRHRGPTALAGVKSGQRWVWPHGLCKTPGVWGCKPAVEAAVSAKAIHRSCWTISPVGTAADPGAARQGRLH